MEQVFGNDDSLPEQRQEAAKKTTWVSMVVNVFLCAVQVLAGMLRVDHFLKYQKN